MNIIKNRHQSGFTIVELLVVIVVIAILAAITIVSYNWVRNDAQDTANESTAQQIIKLVKIKQTRTSDYGVNPIPSNKAALYGEYKASDLSASNKVKISYFNGSTCTAALSDICGTTYTGTYGDKAVVYWMVNNNGFTSVRRWNNQKGVWIISSFYPTGEDVSETAT